MNEAITLKTLADLKAHRLGLNGICDACRYRHELNLDSLMAFLGPDFVFLGNALKRRLRCLKCGEKGRTSIQLHLMYSPGSPPPR
jgi:hypothetical protein